jgi:hypothetical protein
VNLSFLSQTAAFDGASNNWQARVGGGVLGGAFSGGGEEAEYDYNTKVRRCRLTVSKPELKARLVSALETEM